MKSSIKFMVRGAFAAVILLFLAFLIFIWTYPVAFALKVIITLFAVIITLISVIFFWFLSRHINITLAALSETIQSIIDNNPNNKFSIFQDNMLSKLQSQILKLSEILLANAQREKKEKEDIKTLISDISHQLKTPLANLNMYNFFLLNGESNGQSDGEGYESKRKEFTQNMQSQIEKLNWLMESLIKLSKLETGIIDIKRNSSSINQTVLQAINSVSLKALEKNINITFRTDGEIIINYDEKWTQEAIFNILDNAIKYSYHDNLVEVIITKFEMFCSISIIDKGHGIAEGEINKIFSRFYRGKNSAYVEGVGIGLFLSRKIISEQGGFIKVKSELGKGSKFSIFMPLN